MKYFSKFFFIASLIFTLSNQLFANELNVYTEYGKLIVEGKKEEKEKESEYVYQGLAQRSFNRTWSLSEYIEVREVSFKDGLLTVKLGKVVPEHHARKDYM